MVLSPINRSSVHEESDRAGMVPFIDFSMPEIVPLPRVHIPVAFRVGGRACAPANPHSPATMLGHRNSI